MKAPKMVNLSIEETSGVDHPAHLHEGWMVVKAADQSDVDAVIAALATPTPTEEDSMTEHTTDETTEAATTAEDALAKAEERIAELEARLAAAPAPADDVAPSEDDVLKSAPEAIVKMVNDARAEKDAALAKAAAAEAELTKERDAAADADAIEKASAWKNLSLDPAVVGPALRRLATHDEDLAKSITEALAAANAQAESGAIFAEIGKSAPVMEGAGNAVARLHILAKAAVDNGQAATIEQAFADIAVANPALYAEYVTEKGA